MIMARRRDDLFALSAKANAKVFSSLRAAVISVALFYAFIPGESFGYRVVGIEGRDDAAIEFAWRDTLSEIQKILAAFGYYKGPVNGRVNEATIDAIRKYRRRNGIIDDEMIWPSVLVHMRALGEALKMQKSLKAARARQIEEARLKLEQHSGSRELVVQGATKEVADPTHDPSICFSAPTLRCLIEEALETIKGINRQRYRNWALQDLVGVQAQAGLIDMMRETLKRITDARLILVSLRDSVGIMSSLGRTDEAQDMIEMMPSGRDRIRSLVSVAQGLLARGDKAGAIEIVERLKTELTEFKSGQFPAQVHAEVAVVFAQFGLLNQSENALERIATAPDSTEVHPIVFGNIIAAYAGMGRLDAAEEKLTVSKSSSDFRKGRMALSATYAKLGEIDRALHHAEGIESPRYRVIALSGAAMSAIAAGNNDGGLRMLEAALSSMPDVEGEFATDYAWSNIAEVQGRLGAREDAKNTALRIESRDMRARTLWKLSELSANVGREEDRSFFENLAIVQTKETDYFKRVSIWSEAPVGVAKAGNMALSRKRLNRAIAIVREIKLRWWRARAISRVARAFIVLETEAARR